MNTNINTGKIEIDLASFLSPAGLLLGEITQCVLEFLSVEDLVVFMSSADDCNDDINSDEDGKSDGYIGNNGGDGDGGDCSASPSIKQRRHQLQHQHQHQHQRHPPSPWPSASPSSSSPSSQFTSSSPAWSGTGTGPSKASCGRRNDSVRESSRSNINSSIVVAGTTINSSSSGGGVNGSSNRSGSRTRAGVVNGSSPTPPEEELPHYHEYDEEDGRNFTFANNNTHHIKHHRRTRDGDEAGGGSLTSAPNQCSPREADRVERERRNSSHSSSSTTRTTGARANKPLAEDEGFFSDDCNNNDRYGRKGGSENDMADCFDLEQQEQQKHQHQHHEVFGNSAARGVTTAGAVVVTAAGLEQKQQNQCQQQQQQKPSVAIIIGAENVSKEGKKGSTSDCNGDDGSEGGAGVISKVFGVLLELGPYPRAALGAVREGVLNLIRGVPLLAFLRWASEGASTVLGVSFRVAFLPFDVTKGIVSHVVGSLQVMLTIAYEVWYEVRHLTLAELASVVSCILKGKPLPAFFLHPPNGRARLAKGSLSVGNGRSRTGAKAARVSPLSPSATPILGPEGARASSNPVQDSSCGSISDEFPSETATGEWRLAHALRRRLDRVNRTASLVSYLDQPGKSVSQEEAKLVRERMHHDIPFQGFKATVTADCRNSPASSNKNGGFAGSRGGSSSVSGAGSYSMCTPQSFPSTPISRAQVLARSSKFTDDVVFLARDQLRSAENLKAEPNKTTYATAGILRQQKRPAVLDNVRACDGVVFKCGHHQETKVGTSLYSSVRAMVPILRNRHMYFEISCSRKGPLPPNICIGLSTPEMPLSSLVGSFSNSIGLCSTGQVLMSSRWYGKADEFSLSRSRMSTVGVLVYVDSSRSFRSWEGEVMRALVCFSVDGRLVRVATACPPSPSADVGVTPNTEGADMNACPTPPSSPASSPSPSGGAAKKTSEQSKATTSSFSLSSSWPAATPTLPTSPTSEEVAPWKVAASGAGGDGFGEGQRLGAFGLITAVRGVMGATLANGSGVDAAATSSSAGQRPGFNDGCMSAEGRREESTAPPEVLGLSDALGLGLPEDRDLYPTVTIHSADTEILCRFGAEDLLNVKRENIGAPPGAQVYALDGSVIYMP